MRSGENIVVTVGSVVVARVYKDGQERVVLAHEDSKLLGGGRSRWEKRRKVGS